MKETIEKIVDDVLLRHGTKTIYVGHAIEVINRQWITVKEVNELKTRLTALLEEEIISNTNTHD